MHPISPFPGMFPGKFKCPSYIITVNTTTFYVQLVYTHTGSIISLEPQRTGRNLSYSYTGSIVYGPLTQALATLAVLAEESMT